MPDEKKAAPRRSGPSAKTQIEAVKAKDAQARRNLRERLEGEVEKTKARMRAAKKAAEANAGRVVRTLEVLGGAAVGGAAVGAYPDFKLGPLDLRKGGALLLGAVGLYGGGKGMSDHAMNFAEGMAASIVSDFGKDAGAKWRQDRSSTEKPATTDATKTETKTETEPVVKGTPTGAGKIRQVTMSTPETDLRERRRSGAGIPRRRAA